MLGSLQPEITIVRTFLKGDLAGDEINPLFLSSSESHLWQMLRSLLRTERTLYSPIWFTMARCLHAWLRSGPTRPSLSECTSILSVITASRPICGSGNSFSVGEWEEGCPVASPLIPPRGEEERTLSDPSSHSQEAYILVLEKRGVFFG